MKSIFPNQFIMEAIIYVVILVSIGISGAMVIPSSEVYALQVTVIVSNISTVQTSSSHPSIQYSVLLQCGYKGDWLCNATTEYCNRKFADQSRNNWGHCQPCSDICTEKEHKNECMQKCPAYFTNNYVNAEDQRGDPDVNFFTSEWTRRELHLLTVVIVLAAVIMIILTALGIALCLSRRGKSLDRMCKTSTGKTDEEQKLVHPLAPTPEVGPGSDDVDTVSVDSPNNLAHGISHMNGGPLVQSARVEQTPVRVTESENHHQTCPSTVIQVDSDS